MRKNKPNIKLKSNRRDDYFNYWLRDARIAKGYTINQLAKEVGVSNASIEFYETLRTIPKSHIAERIANTLDKTVEELFPEKLNDIKTEINIERAGGSIGKYIQDLKRNRTAKTDYGKKVIARLQKLTNTVPIYSVSKNKFIVEYKLDFYSRDILNR